MIAEATSNRRNLQLDILRGLAILLVLGRHLELPHPDGFVGLLSRTWFRLGWLGVDLFFVLSGFLIGGLLIGELHKHGRIDVPRFLIRRGLKIYPPYFVFIAYLILVPTAKALLRDQDAVSAFLAQWKMYWPNLLFLQNYVGANPAGHTWTLAVEEHFYLLLPFALVGLAARNGLRILIPLCLVVVPTLILGLRALSLWTGDPYGERMAATHLRLDALLFGVGLRAVAQYLPETFAAARLWRGWFFGVGLALWSINLFIEPSTVFVRTVGLLCNFLGSTAFLLACFHTRGADFGARRRFVAPLASLIGWIGVYSYAIYLWHVTAMGILEREIGGRILAWSGGPTQLAWLISTTLVCAGAVMAGVVAAKVVEWPVLRLRDRIFPSRLSFRASEVATDESQSRKIPQARARQG